MANACQVILLIGYIIVKKVHKQTWPGWSLECLYDWNLYLKYGLGGVGMTVFEWAFFEIAVISTSVLSSTDISVMSITLQIMFLVSMVYTGIAYSGNIRIGYVIIIKRLFYHIIECQNLTMFLLSFWAKTNQKRRLIR